MTAVSGTCPQCHHKVDDRHCEGRLCHWWRCLACKISFRPRDGRILPPAPAGGGPR